VTDLLLQFGLSNLVLSLLIAAAAWGVHRVGRWPSVAHLLWLVVLVKLVTPPVVALPGVTLPGWMGHAPTRPAPSAEPGTAPANTGALAEVSVLLPETAPLAVTDRDPAPAADTPLPHNAVAPLGSASAGPTALPEVWPTVRRVLVGVWLAGSVLVLAVTLWRVVRFNRLLTRASAAAPLEVQRLAQDVGRRLGLRRTPTVYTARARLSPMVWWVGGRVRVVLPADVADTMPASQLRWVLAHELAHVRRRDHAVRWIEWLACVGFWWNPAAWWARRNLRANEEACCDALVLGCLAGTHDTPKHYADAILRVVESLALPALRPPAIASEINSGGTLERRFEMILSSKTLTKSPRWVHGLVLAGAAGLLPLGLAQAGELEAKQADRAAQQADLERVAERIRRAVEAGDLSAEEARRKMREVRAMMQAQAERADARRRGDQRDGERPGEREAEFRALGIDEASYDAAVAYLAEQGVGRIQMDAAMGALARISHAMREQPGAFELNETLAGYLTREVGLDRGQVRALLEVATKLAAEASHAADPAAHSDEADIRGYFLRMGVDEATLDHIIGALREHGVGRVQIEPTLGGLFHTILAIKEHGMEEAMSAIDAHAFFSEQVGLSDEQIELVAGIARRVYEGLRDHHEERAEAEAQLEAVLARLKAAVEAGELTAAQARARMEVLKLQWAERAAAEEARRQREGERRGDAARRDGEREAREQDGDRARREREEAVRDRAQRDGDRARREQERRDHAERDAEKPDPHAQAERVRGAYASGALSADAAEEYLSAIREELIHQVELALEAGKITRDEAREKVAAIRAMTRLPEREGAGR
jgi:beta-lactamase regulating signal transducer with metallopeptidase domain